ncbi:MAG: winged helix-turn-helix domain-containing protein [Candidatus Saccharimonadales bacterium]
MKILIDSQQSVAEDIKRVLENAGYQVALASHGVSDDKRTGCNFLLTELSREANILKNGNIELDNNLHTLKRNKKTVRVTPLEFRIIGFFMAHTGEIITKDVLAAGCWPQKQEVSNNTIEVYIKRIRGKLGASSIRTIHSIGYQMDKK